MESNRKFVVDHSSARGDSISREEVVQAVRDINAWLSASDPAYALREGIQEVPGSLPPMLAFLLNLHNGGIQLHETFITLSLGEILEAIELCKVSIYWKLTYTPFARNSDGEILMVENTDGEVVQWNLDIGVVEQIAKNLETLIENFRNNILTRKYQYLGPDCGVIEAV